MDEARKGFTVDDCSGDEMVVGGHERMEHDRDLEWLTAVDDRMR